MDHEWSLKSRISKLLRKEFSSDVQFLVGTTSQKYLCHKAILAAGSEVFETMFYGGFEQKNSIRVPDVTPKGFALMLRYLYSDSVTFQDESEAFETAYSAKKYMIQSLFDICENYLMDSLVLGPENVLFTHEESSFLGMKNLRDRCLRYVSRHAREVLRSKSFAKVSRDTFENVLTLEHMDIESEREIVEELWSWGEQQCLDEGVDCTVKNVRRYTCELLKHVRFFAMTLEELTNTLERCQILDTSDELTLLWNKAMPKTNGQPPMPFGICRESKTRSIRNSSKVQFAGQYRYNGSMTSYLVENHQMRVEIAVSGSPVIVTGVVVAFKPIPCYSCSNRFLEVEIRIANGSEKTRAKSRFKTKEDPKESGEIQQVLLLDDFIVIREQQVGFLTVTVDAEGVLLMQVMKAEVSHDLGTTEVRLKVDQSEEGNKLFLPIKELMVI